MESQGTDTATPLCTAVATGALSLDDAAVVVVPVVVVAPVAVVVVAPVAVALAVDDEGVVGAVVSFGVVALAVAVALEVSLAVVASVAVPVSVAVADALEVAVSVAAAVPTGVLSGELTAELPEKFLVPLHAARASDPMAKLMKDLVKGSMVYDPYPIEIPLKAINLSSTRGPASEVAG